MRGRIACRQTTASATAQTRDEVRTRVARERRAPEDILAVVNALKAGWFTVSTAGASIDLLAPTGAGGRASTQVRPRVVANL